MKDLASAPKVRQKRFLERARLPLGMRIVYKESIGDSGTEEARPRETGDLESRVVQYAVEEVGAAPEKGGRQGLAP